MFTDRSIRNSCISLNQIKEAMCVYGSFDSQFVHLIKSTILARKGILALIEQTRYKCIFFVLNVENTRNAFYKTRAVRNPCTEGNIDRSKSALVEQTRCKCLFFVVNVENTEMLSIKRARFVILARKGILIVARVR